MVVDCRLSFARSLACSNRRLLILSSRLTCPSADDDDIILWL
jgi:hypothetical protein